MIPKKVPVNQLSGVNNERLNEELRLQQEIAMLESMVKKKLTKEALLRYGNVKAAHPQLALNLILILSNLIQTGKVDVIDDAQLKDVLLKLNSQKKDFRIMRK